MYIWDLSIGQLFTVLRGYLNPVLTVAHSPDGSILASGSQDGTLHLWNVATGQCFRTLQGDPRMVISLAFSANNSILISGLQSIQIWNTQTWALLGVIREESYALVVSPDNRMIAGITKDGLIRLWDARTGVVKNPKTGHNTGAPALAFHPHGRFLASGGQGGEIYLWDTDSGTLVHTIL